MSKLPFVIHEDAAILVICKPPGMIVNRSQTSMSGTLQDWVEARGYWKESYMQRNVDADDFLKRSGIVHRLDKETSGLLIIAKTREAFDELVLQFASRTVAKEYLALVHGRLEPKQGMLSLPLARSRSDRKRFAISASGRKSETAWEVIDRFSRIKKEGINEVLYQGFSYVRVRPYTGRTHQIRVHMAHLKHPIVNDPKYSRGRRCKEDRKWCPRLFLHAERLSIDHPYSKKRFSFKAKLTKDLSEVLKLLE